MSNTILTPTMVTREALRILHNKLTFISSIDRQYDKSFAKSGAKIGSQLKVRLPNQFVVRTGQNLDVQNVNEASETITMATQKGVDVQFSSVELTLSLDDFSTRILEPAMSVLAANIEADALNMTKDVYNLVGSPGTVPQSLQVYLLAKAMMNQYLTPKDKNRNVLIDSQAMAYTVDALKGLFQDQAKIAQQYKEGLMGYAVGLNWWENDLAYTHTCGTRDNTTPVTNGDGQTGASLICDGFDNGVTVVAGDVFTIAGVYAVHPETKAAYSHLQQFVVTAAGTADGSGNLTLSISPSIISSGAKQNVSAAPGDGVALTFVGTASTAYRQNLAYHKAAFAFVTADLEMPKGVDFAAREVFDGISMRIVRDYNINNDQFPCRIDVLYGYKTLRGQLACRITA